MVEHEFTKKIFEAVGSYFGGKAKEIFDASELLQYLNIKTVSANKGSKSRGSFANLYSIYILVEDYVKNGYGHGNKDYGKYEGASFSKLMKRQRELPFGKKLQNHALNNRTNGEFEKYFPMSQNNPIIRDLKTQRYWINENLLKVRIGNQTYNIAQTVLDVIDEYVEAKQGAFRKFISQCKELKCAGNKSGKDICTFILSLMTPDMDARLFEIVSFSILKQVYSNQAIYWGYSEANLKKENLKLYKTGRTNANDGGIDFVMKPLGRFFQATETLDFKKYFLDIDKLEHYPVTFVVKSSESVEDIISTIRENAKKTYVIESVVKNYMDCIEEIINIEKLSEAIKNMDEQELNGVLREIILQSKVEFNQ